MNALLDTHILLWTLSNDARLPKKARNLIEDENNEIYYSIISLWEVELKHLTHPHAMPVSAKQLTEYCAQSGFHKVSLNEKHIYAMGDLKREKDAQPHKDPFDRILICQASIENMIFITHDSLIGGYNEPYILTV